MLDVIGSIMDDQSGKYYEAELFSSDDSEEIKKFNQEYQASKEAIHNKTRIVAELCQCPFCKNFTILPYNISKTIELNHETIKQEGLFSETTGAQQLKLVGMEVISKLIKIGSIGNCRHKSIR